MKVGEVFADLLAKAGVDVTSESLKPVLGISIDIDDEFTKALQEKLFTLEAAKSKPELKKHFVGPFAQGLDQDVKEFLESNGYSDILEKIADTKSTGQRIKAILNEITAKKDGGDDEKAVLKTLKEQNAKLNADLAKEKQDKSTFETKLRDEFDQNLVKMSVLSKFDSQQWSETIPEAARKVLADQFWNQELQKHKAKAAKDESGNVVLINTETQSPVYDQKNNLLTVEGLIKDIMTVNKFIKVTNDNGGGGTNQNRVIIPDDGTAKNQQRNASLVDKSLADQGFI